jgi:hypothetical protein
MICSQQFWSQGRSKRNRKTKKTWVMLRREEMKKLTKTFHKGKFDQLILINNWCIILVPYILHRPINVFISVLQTGNFRNPIFHWRSLRMERALEQNVFLLFYFCFKNITMTSVQSGSMQLWHLSGSMQLWHLSGSMQLWYMSGSMQLWHLSGSMQLWQTTILWRDGVDSPFKKSVLQRILSTMYD